jgi:hypothetical protein
MSDMAIYRQLPCNGLHKATLAGEFNRGSAFLPAASRRRPYAASMTFVIPLRWFS